MHTIKYCEVGNMEKNYETPEIEIIMFSDCDIITTSPGGNKGGDHGITLPPVTPGGW